MPVEALRRPVRAPASTPMAATPPRLRPKGPVGRQAPAPEPRPKQSAVERLEADKAKYVKSQEALSKQQPIRAAEGRRPAPSPASATWLAASPASALRPTPNPVSALRSGSSPASARLPAQSPASALHLPSSPAPALRPTRRAQTPTKAKQECGVQLDLEHLSNLISDVTEGPPSSATLSSEESKAPPPAETPQKKERPTPPPRTAHPDWAGPAKVRLKSSATLSASPGSAAAGTVRRVDVMPPTGPPRAPCRPPPQFMRQPLQPIPPHPQFPLRPATSHLRLFQLRTNNTPPSPLKPVVATSPAANPPAPSATPPPPAFPLFPPPSPAITRRSSSSSRKRPSLTRSKSDMSDRYSRAGTELERFFNLCGLDPADLQDLPGSSSDIVSLARFRSVSAPGSECAGSGEEGNDDDEDEEEAGNVEMRVPYGVSIIERNARVIKWLYGMRQAKDAGTKSTNL